MQLEAVVAKVLLPFVTLLLPNLTPGKSIAVRQVEGYQDGRLRPALIRVMPARFNFIRVRESGSQ